MSVRHAESEAQGLAWFGQNQIPLKQHQLRIFNDCLKEFIVLQKIVHL